MYWTDISKTFAVVQSPEGKIAYIDWAGNLLIRGKSKSLWEPRKPDVWRIRKKGFRERLLRRGWHMRGAYAENTIGGESVMVKTASEERDCFLCRFQFKADLREESMAKHRGKQPDEQQK